VSFVTRGDAVVVTGAGSGIGRATAVAFAERGATVLATDINADSAARTVELCRAVGGDAQAHTVDVGDVDAIEALAKHVEQGWGAARVVVNNAGIGIAGPQLAMTPGDWEEILRVNLWGVIHGSRVFANQMVANAQPRAAAEGSRRGHIVNVASAAAFAPSRALPAYSTTKSAVAMLTECLALELTAQGIGASAICPGIINTSIPGRTRWVGVSSEEQAARAAEATRLYQRRNYGPEKVAAAIVHAVDHNRVQVPVSPEAHLMAWGWRLAPGIMRGLGARDLT
jgi:NAD(P)-dependent dehydrogenase (short-subunit alcohol dehydrogenase family)